MSDSAPPRWRGLWQNVRQMMPKRLSAQQHHSSPSSPSERIAIADSRPSVDPVIVTAADHGIGPDTLSVPARKVLQRLDDAGYEAYLVGGGVRDALVGQRPKDFDVATNASPEQVRELFRNSRIIGRRFRLVHVLFGRDMIEVATFRADHASGAGGEVGQGGRILRDNVFGTIEDDAVRRDFTVNALYYSLAGATVLDYVGGLDDLDDGVFRLIGDPVVRCEEDPVRVLRAARLAAKLDFDIHEDTLDAMYHTAPLLVNMPPARLFEEVLKLFQGGYALRSFERLLELDLLRYLFPATDDRLRNTDQNTNGNTDGNTDAEPADTGNGKAADKGSAADATGRDDDFAAMLRQALANTDARIAQEKPVTPAFLLAFMLWGDVEERARLLLQEDHSAADALHTAADEIMARQTRVTSIPKRFSGPMREIWLMQPQLELYNGARALSLLEQRRFRAAYDFLLLRAEFDERLRDCATWWTDIQEMDADDQEAHLDARPAVESDWKSNRPRRKRSRRRPRRKGGNSAATESGGGNAHNAGNTVASARKSGNKSRGKGRSGNGNRRGKSDTV